MTKQPKLGTGKRFAKVEDAVEEEYEKKGMSPKKAKAIGGAVAAKAGRAKYGEKKMSAWATKSKAKHSKMLEEAM